MHIRSLAGKNICILGYGKEGKAMVEALEQFAPGCEITIADQNASIEIDNAKHWKQVGTGWLENLHKFDVLIKSPGIPLLSELKPHTSKLTSPTQIFLDSIADSGATVIGVTGSKGKSTTSSLIHHILSSHSSKPTAQSFLIGNIGEPSIAHIADAKKDTIFVLEMSSYQLMDLTVSPEIAVVTSFFPEHLDYHGSLETYKEAKKHIARFQTRDDHIYYNAKYPECKEIAEESVGFIHPFSDLDAPVMIEETKLKGSHNLSNIAVAFLVSEQLGVPEDIIKEAIKNFTPLPHRLESLGVHHGVEWVNDSISTTPESAIAGLDALGDRVQTIILGGHDRGYDFSPLVRRLKTSKVKTVILLPESGKKIGKMIEEAKLEVECLEVENMEGAVEIAKKQIHHDRGSETRSQINNSQFSILNSQYPIVLLSPASPSYGHFKNFEDRGEQFKKNIESEPKKSSSTHTNT